MFSGIKPLSQMAGTVLEESRSGSEKWINNDCVELSSSSSLTVQSIMAKGWEKVLRRRAVARLGAARSSRSRAFRLAKMSARWDLVLREEGRGLPMQILPTLVEAPFFCSDSGSVEKSDGDSEDEPLIRRVASRDEFRQSSVEYQSSEEDAVMKEVSGAEESENEGTSEEESDIESDGDDKVEFLGR